MDRRRRKVVRETSTFHRPHDVQWTVVIVAWSAVRWRLLRTLLGSGIAVRWSPMSPFEGWSTSPAGDYDYSNQDAASYNDHH